eukprot:m.15400 g.15400  ORF g.15400 m.15400 type:complete len:183 (+) comp5382_c0_seq2:250-798(+)
MVRKFGSQEAFDMVKKRHGLIPRGNEAGMDESNGWTQTNLDKRIQSSTLNAHRLVLYVDQQYSQIESEKLYAVLNRLHFTQGAVLNDKNVLLAAVAEVFGKEASMVQDCARLLTTDAGKKETLSVSEQVTATGIHSIPTLIINGYAITSPTAGTETVLDSIVETVKAKPEPRLQFPIPKISF